MDSRVARDGEGCNNNYPIAIGLPTYKQVVVVSEGCGSITIFAMITLYRVRTAVVSYRYVNRVARTHRVALRTNLGFDRAPQNRILIICRLRTRARTRAWERPSAVIFCRDLSVRLAMCWEVNETESPKHNSDAT